MALYIAFSGLTCVYFCVRIWYSLVFHSLDKITSAFIHITPLCLTFLLRYGLVPSRPTHRGSTSSR